jgi:hypothetical protein
MFGLKEKENKLSGPGPIPSLVQKHLISDKKLAPNWQIC